MRTASLVGTTGWTFDQIAEADHYEVERMLRVSTVRAGVEEQERELRGG